MRIVFLLKVISAEIAFFILSYGYYFNLNIEEIYIIFIQIVLTSLIVHNILYKILTHLGSSNSGKTNSIFIKEKNLPTSEKDYALKNFIIFNNDKPRKNDIKSKKKIYIIGFLIIAILFYSVYYIVAGYFVGIVCGDIIFFFEKDHRYSWFYIPILKELNCFSHVRRIYKFFSILDFMIIYANNIYHTNWLFFLELTF